VATRGHAGLVRASRLGVVLDEFVKHVVGLGVSANICIAHACVVGICYGATMVVLVSLLIKDQSLCR
jgi:hypothetical protein